MRRRPRPSRRRAVSAATLDEVAHCDVVLLAVFDTDQVEDVVTNAMLPALTPGTPKTVLCASTCDPDRIAALIAPRRAANRDDRDAGVGLERTGAQRRRRRPDRRRTDAIDGVADILDALYPKWFYMGAAGNGGRAKLAINHMLGLNRLVLAEGLVFAERLGLERGKLPRRGAPVGRL